MPDLMLQTGHTRRERHKTLTEERVVVFSREEPEPLYRYFLSIVWDERLPVLVALMLNPSKADHLKNDPTVARICERARRLGFGAVIILNAFAWRETDRLEMLKAAEPVGELNDCYILETLLQAKAKGWTVLVGWGNEGGHRGRSARMARLLRQAEVQAVCLKMCENGEPGHPLYIGYDVPFMPWPRERNAA